MRPQGGHYTMTHEVGAIIYIVYLCFVQNVEICVYGASLGPIYVKKPHNCIELQ